ncbi:MAG TPA: hypothetical protein VFY65_17325, partial [Longimicrobium sp.]|nr:hypothetical protein [Longimicrobium sp.]
EELAGAVVLGLWPFYVLGVAGVMRLRRTLPDAPRPYRTLGYPVVPLLFLMASVFLLGSSLAGEPALTLQSLGVVMAGVPVYYARRALTRP